MKILYINSCVRENSRTNLLARYLLSKFNQEFDEVNLDTERIIPLDNIMLKKRDLCVCNQNFEDKVFNYAKQFANADIIVIAAPYWDLSFPAILKSYFEAINVVGITFKYSENGIPQTMCKAKKLIYITTAGGAIISDDYGFGYTKAISEAFYGIKDIEYYKAEGLDVIGANIENILNITKQEIDKNYNT